ncbi:MAG: 4a-hydroxytetrahydrobiopterin dehydratase [Planctomycetota bacterium]|nr:MAG: 4a-hydroxytetrahydrobiopterin dehydratase [Planctomycetota bacterium]
MARRKLTADEVEQRRPAAPQWNVEGGALQREFLFADFVAAFGFMTQVALVAESMDHHPDWSNVYRTVRITLSTHDVGGLSELDFQLAAKIDALVPDAAGSSS